MDTSEKLPYGKVLVLHVNDPVSEAARALCDKDVGSVVVADHKGRMIGMLTDRDLVCTVIAAKLDASTPLGKVMTKGLVWATEDSSISEIIKLMTENGIRRVPIVAKTSKGFQKCVGIVSVDDLVLLHLITADQLAAIVVSQVYRKGPKAVRRQRSRAREFQIIVERKRRSRFWPPPRKNDVDIDAEDYIV